MISNNDIDNVIEAERRGECITIGRLAPDFIALSTQGYIRLSDYKGKWVILFSQPMAFYPVSTTEIIETSRNYSEFQKRNVQFISLTTDNIFSNLNWIYDIYLKTGIHVPYPIISDNNKEIVHLYGMMNVDRTYEESVRDAFIISPEGRIRSIITLPITCGRSGNELLRILDSLQLTENQNLFTPANWNQGEPVIVPPPTTYNEIINRVNTMDEHDLQCLFWYLCYKNINATTNIYAQKYKHY